MDHGLAAALLGLGGIFQLFADGDLVAQADQPGQIAFHRMDRHTGHGDVLALVLAPLGQGDAQGGGRHLGVLEEQFVEIPHAEEEYGVRLSGLGRQILRHEGRRPFQRGGDFRRMFGGGKSGRVHVPSG